MISAGLLWDFVQESFGIEGIELTTEEQVRQVRETAVFLLSEPTLENVLTLLLIIEPSAAVRDKSGMNVRVGNHRAPPGGPEIKEKLEYMLTELHVSPRRWHIEFEKLHPFTDGNGRVGRMIWLHQMVNQKGYEGELGFLHMWYYQSFG